MILKKRVLIIALMVLAVFLSVSTISAIDVNTVDSNSTVVTASDDSISIDGLQDYSLSSNNIIEETNVVGDTKSNTKAVHLDAPSVEMYYKNGTRFTINLTDENGNGLVNQSINIIINGVSYNRTTDNNGIASLALNLNSGKYLVNVTYTGTNGYASASTTSEVNVLPTIYGKDIVKYYVNGTQYYATFLNGDGTPLVNTDVTFNINGVFYKRTTNGSGVARLNINLDPGVFILTAIHPGDKYQVGNKVTVVNVVSTNIKTQKYDFVIEDNKIISAVLYDQFNHVVPNQSVTLSINGVTYSNTTNANGVVKFNIKLNAPGKYSATYTFNKNNGYLESKSSNTINVVEGKKVSFTVPENVVVKGNSFSVILKDEDGKVLANKVVYFNVNGVTYSRVTDEKGVAKLNINLDPALYDMTYTFNGTGYVKTTQTIKLAVINVTSTVIYGDNIEVGKGAGQKFNVLLTAGGVPLPNKDITISVNGVNYTRTTNDKGIASLTINLDIGTYYITYAFKGDSKLSPSNGSAYCIVVNRKNSAFSINSTTVFSQNSKDSFKVLLKDGEGNSLANEIVTFSINGMKYNRTTDAKGIASLTINLSTVGQYEISYKFAGNNNYLGCEDGALIVITKYIDNGNGYWLWAGDMYNVNLDSLASSGTGVIFLNYYAFTKFSQSSVLSWIKQANSKGIKVHIWMQVFYNGGWLSPLNDDGSMNTELFNSKIAEAKKYASLPGVAGIHLDYLRYPGTAYKHPGGTEAINEFARLASSAIHAINPNCVVSAAVMPEKNDIYYYGQDISTLSKYLDVIVPMVYKGNYKSGTSWISSITQWFVETSNGAAIWVGLQTYASDSNVTKLPVSELFNDAQTAYNAGASGVMMFRWGVTNFIDFNKLDTYHITPSQGSSVSITDISKGAANLKKYIEANGILPKYISVGNSNYTMPQFLYLMVKATGGLGNGNSSAIKAILVNDPSKTSGAVINKQLVKSEFLSLAQSLANYMYTKGVAPSNISSTLGDIKYESLIYAYSRTLAYHYSNSALPNFVFVTNLLDNYSLTVTMKLSAGGTSYKSNIFYTTMWLNYCPHCNYYGTLLVNPKGTAEGELTCAYCDADYCGVSGKEKITSSTIMLTRLTESIPESSGKSGDSISINSILSAAKYLKDYIKANNALPGYVVMDDEQYNLPQFLYLMSKAIANINDGNLGNISVVSVGNPGTPNGDIINKNINKTEYLDVAYRVAQFIIDNGQAPNYASSSVGKISYSELLDSFSRILTYYSQNSKTLPNMVLINNTMDSGASANVADKAKSLVVGLTSEWDKANALFKFVRDNIKYGAYGTGKLYYNTVYGAEGTLIKGYGNCCDQSQLLVAMARSVGLTARFATGYCHFSSGLNVGHVWVQFNIGGKWVAADPTSTRNSLGVINNWNVNSYTDRGTYDVLPY